MCICREGKFSSWNLKTVVEVEEKFCSWIHAHAVIFMVRAIKAFAHFSGRYLFPDKHKRICLISLEFYFSIWKILRIQTFLFYVCKNPSCLQFCGACLISCPLPPACRCNCLLPFVTFFTAVWLVPKLERD